ncbi:MAG TPA: DUF92 domain-containing protein [Terriglobales bacterium]|nr:DUF92 domain-containing protein [Terriglobales bacterium]
MSPIFAGLEILNPSQPLDRLVPALLVTAVFGVLGYVSRGVTASGAVAGAVAALLIYVSLGLGGFVTLFGVFAATWLSTRIGYTRKRQLGIAEDKHGRNAKQVLANVGAAAGYAVLTVKFGPAFAVAAVASLAEATADTVSSELGEVLSAKPRLITSFNQVEPGTNGAISLPGTGAALVSALVIALIGAMVGLYTPSVAWLAAAAGFLGTIVDSLLGATLERSGTLKNNGVNSISTIFAGVIALVLYFVGA